MPRIAVNGTRLYYEDTGEGEQTILFSHGLLWDGRMFAPQVAALSERFRCVTYDHRGQGRSDVPPESSIPMDLLYADAVALIGALDLAPCHFVGLSMGGFVGMRVAARSPELLRSLVLLETSARPEPSENIRKYQALTWVTRLLGPGVVADQVMPIMFGRSFLEDPDRAAERERWRAILSGNRKDIHKAVTGVIQRDGIENELGSIPHPTLVMVGHEDVATTPDRSEAIADAIPDAKLVRIPDAGHSSTIENPDFVNEVLTDWFTARTED